MTEEEKLREENKKLKEHIAAIENSNDGYGGPAWCGTCHAPLQVVRPGKCQCSFCEERELMKVTMEGLFALCGQAWQFIKPLAPVMNPTPTQKKHNKWNCDVEELRETAKDLFNLETYVEGEPKPGTGKEAMLRKEIAALRDQLAAVEERAERAERIWADVSTELKATQAETAKLKEQVERLHRAATRYLEESELHDPLNPTIQSEVCMDAAEDELRAALKEWEQA